MRENVIDFSEVFNDSFDTIRLNSATFYDRFYQVFREASPDIDRVFNGVDIEKQKDMLHIAIMHLVQFFVSKEADSYLLKVAYHHKKIYQVSDEMYDLFFDSLMQTLSEFYPKYGPTCRVAWKITLAPGLELMKNIADIYDQNILGDSIP
ncbi:hypothetical protein [Teredinibacter sp. KSP-S5-2]|uniref:hypothetical protein n=1 Tax=Teredinibacter sp. KSP-S5-2 TaxID=3034506 RepID=UPI002934E17F|nr:hypothetical protein [Teredinibacter sp. KSP-S5-2]WNO09581.1 hypothetical protein P5V12_00100 [Teredinibacter sp. KSP-S5-2]